MNKKRKKKKKPVNLTEYKHIKNYRMIVFFFLTTTTEFSRKKSHSLWCYYNHNEYMCMDQVVEYFFFLTQEIALFRSIHSIGKYNEIYRSLLNCAHLNRTDKNLRLINYRISFLVYEKRKKNWTIETKLFKKKYREN